LKLRITLKDTVSERSQISQKNFGFEKRWSRGKKGKGQFGIISEKAQLKVASFQMGMTPFQVMYQ